MLVWHQAAKKRGPACLQPRRFVAASTLRRTSQPGRQAGAAALPPKHGGAASAPRPSSLAAQSDTRPPHLVCSLLLWSEPPPLAGSARPAVPQAASGLPFSACLAYRSGDPFLSVTH
jgi:hypothetical protein